MTKYLSGAALAALVAGAAVPASAVTVQINLVNAAWSDGVLNDGTTAGIAYSGNGTALAEVEWGGDERKSSYEFASEPDQTVEVSGSSDSEDFTIGSFTHNNFVIAPPSLDFVTLSVNAQIIVGGTDLGVRTFTFLFDHSETPNDADPCPFGPADGSGINSDGCADQVTFSSDDEVEEFLIGTDRYTLSLTGFVVDGVPTSEFLTREEAVNVAQLLGRITLRAVPSPAAVGLFGLGLVGLGLARRRRA